MTKIRVLGAGECGTLLARRLLDGGIPVTMVTDRGVEAVLSDTVTSTQVKFPATLDLETEAGLNMWRSTAPQILGIRFTMAVDRAPVAGWVGRFTRPAQSVDQRTVFGRWLTDYVAAGGDLQVTDLSPDDIDRTAGDYDLTIVTRGGREVADWFPADPHWNVSATPERHMLVLYLDGVEPDPDDLGIFVALPGLGEVISYPALTGPPGRERRCDTLLIAARPGTELDVFTPYSTTVDRLIQGLTLLERHFSPALAHRFRNAELTDAGGTLVGGVAPRMRRPVGTSPSGALVLGGGDMVCRMDPSGAQGANSAVHCGFHYSAAILRNPDGPFDRAWMEETASGWLTETAYPAARWTMTMLEPPREMQGLMLAAQQDGRLADMFADTFARPASLSSLMVAVAS
ncbi:styrene monooxygenase/indole monooxygenase family protein [Nocardia brevicatena]|uniref:styrene monooxygenase/indole monooxygenase family protein n=1 Tax=Nocardia brevicatena TaxID=37327 RepID=UPI0002FF86E1|nr:styrene monooxygenase/indole monooxygenase family protein [Nocardia brevicatena]